MSFQDGPPQKTALQNDTFRSFGPPIILLGGMGFFIWAFGQYLWKTAEGNTDAIPNFKPVVAKASKAGGVVPTNSGAIQGIVNEQSTGNYDPSGAAPDGVKKTEDDGAGAISIMAEKTPEAKVVNEWKLRGVIYDLVTLKPLPGVSMTFTDNETNSRAVVLTDAKGRYRTILPPLTGRGYLVSLAKSGYAKTYLNPGTEGVSEMTLDRRKELTKELSTSILEPASLQPDSETPLVTNFHMAPQ